MRGGGYGAGRGDPGGGLKGSRREGTDLLLASKGNTGTKLSVEKRVRAGSKETGHPSKLLGDPRKRLQEKEVHQPHKVTKPLDRPSSSLDPEQKLSAARGLLPGDHPLPWTRKEQDRGGGG